MIQQIRGRVGEEQSWPARRNARSIVSFNLVLVHSSSMFSDSRELCYIEHFRQVLKFVLLILAVFSGGLLGVVGPIYQLLKGVEAGAVFH